jgi:hypothetical protein
VLGFRVRAQQLDRDAGPLDDTAVLDIGVQDTGSDGGLWALAIRGVDVPDPPSVPSFGCSGRTISLAIGEFLHPWWLYVAGPPGAVLGVLYAAGIGRPDAHGH